MTSQAVHVAKAWGLGLALALALLGGTDLHAATSTGTLTVSAAVLSKSNCKFKAGAALVLNFGNIDPSSASNVVVPVTKLFVCNGSAPTASFSITANDGLYSVTPGVRRMRHGVTTTEFMTYSLGLTPTAATAPKGVDQTLTITGTLTPADFQNSLTGAYSDTVVITLSP